MQAVFLYKIPMKSKVTGLNSLKKNSLFTVTYTGLISVKNENSIKEAMKKGIGGKKTYGCGMLTVIKKAVRHTGTDTF